MPAPSRDEFIRWREDAVTRWVFMAIEQGAEQSKAKWIDHSWGNGHANPLLLSELRTRTDAYNELMTASYEDWLAVHEEEEPI